jgi:hypothetical protein
MSTGELMKLSYKKLEHRHAAHTRVANFWKLASKAFAFMPRIQKKCEIKATINEFNACVVKTAIIFKNLEDKAHEVC